MIKAPVITGCRFEESGYGNDDERWSAELLYESAKRQGCKEFKLPLAHIDIAWPRFKGDRIYDMAYYHKRILDADTSIPIIMGPLGGILDGAHRIVKALVNGDQWIPCFKLRYMPEPDGKDTE